MKKNKGFTLIELLAVIVILAIIALIAVPVVMNIIGKANKSAFKDSAYGLLKAGESYYTSELLEDAQGITEDKVFIFPDDIEGLEFKGSKPSRGTMTVRKDGKVSMAISNGKYCVTKGFEDEDVTISDDATNCELGPKVNKLSDLVTTYTFNATSTSTSTIEGPNLVEIPGCVKNKTKCEAGTPVAVKVNAAEIYKFFVLNDDEAKNEVTLIMDRNLGGSVVWNTEQIDDKGPLNALKVLKERTSGWTNIPAYTYTLVDDTFGKYAPISKTASATEGTPESLVENVRARLPKYSEIDAVINSQCLDDEHWLGHNVGDDEEFYGYWTSSTANVDLTRGVVYGVGYGGNMVIASCLQPININSQSYGIRPVITLSK